MRWSRFLLALSLCGVYCQAFSQRIRNTENGHFYEVINNLVTWEQADQAARASSFNYNGLTYYGHLVTITSQQETDWMINHLPYFFGAFMGLRQSPTGPEPAGGWYWITGEPLNYLNWHANEPNQYTNDESYGQLFPDATWNDSIDGPYGYVVEYEPITVTSVTLDNNAILGGGKVTATVHLFVNAPAGGATINLVDDSSFATTPAKVVIPEGQNSATFSLTTRFVDNYQYVLIGARAGITTASCSLTILPANLASVTIAPASIYGGTSQSPVGRVTLTGGAGPSGVKVTLSTSNNHVTLPASVQVPANSSVATFTIGHSLSPTTFTAVISATSTGITKSGQLTVNPVNIVQFTLSPQKVVAGATVAGTITLNQPAPVGGFSIDLSSSIPADLNLGTAKVLIPAGSKTSGFTILTSDKVTTSANLTVSATFNGVSRNAGLTIVPVYVDVLTLNPTSVVGGQRVDLRVALNGAAPTGGADIVLSSPSTTVRFTNPATIVAGATSGTFSISTSAVSGTQTVAIKATYHGVSKTVLLKLTSR